MRFLNWLKKKIYGNYPKWVLIFVDSKNTLYTRGGGDILNILKNPYTDDEIYDLVLKTIDQTYYKFPQTNCSSPGALEKYFNCKSWLKATKKLKIVNIDWSKEEGYKIAPTYKTYKGWSHAPFKDLEKMLGHTPSPYELSHALKQAIEESSLYDHNKPEHGTIELICENAPYETVSYEIPQDDRFLDAQDYHVGEIYQGYSYCPDYNESVAEFYFAMGDDVNCNLDTDNIRLMWEKNNGKSEVFDVKKVDHPIFTIKAEMKNKAIHKISYYKEFAQYEIVTCEMIVLQPNRRKKTDEKLTKLFSEFVGKCNWEKQNEEKK